MLIMKAIIVAAVLLVAVYVAVDSAPPSKSSVTLDCSEYAADGRETAKTKEEIVSLARKCRPYLTEKGKNLIENDELNIQFEKEIDGAGDALNNGDVAEPQDLTYVEKEAEDALKKTDVLHKELGYDPVINPDKLKYSVIQPYEAFKPDAPDECKELICHFVMKD